MATCNRRQFLAATGIVTGGLALSSLGVPLGAVKSWARELTKADKIKTAKTTISTCFFCTVSCGLLCSTDTKTGKIINIEGDPEHPISEGSLCAKGAAMFQTSDNNPHRLTQVLYRAPYSDTWEVKDWSWALEKMARNIKEVRDRDFIEKNALGQEVNRLETIGHMGSSKLDNEECWLISAMTRALGLVHIDHQARVCHSSTVAALGESFGRGAMTNHWIDIRNSDCILVMGSNAAENHPVSFKFVLRAKKKGAKLISVDPRFTRTSAKADFYAGLRSGTDIAFLGGLINHILENKKFFHDYVANYTNGAFLVDEGFDFSDGLFSGYQADNRKYDKTTWSFQKDARGVIRKDPTLRDPRCVLQLLRKHYARYSLEKVSAITGTPVEDLEAVYGMYSATGAADKAGTIMYALGWTQHTVGTQNIRTMAIIQLLLGNIGVCGGGVNALRGEPNVQGSTDHCILYHLLPGYLKAPKAQQTDLKAYLQAYTPHTNEPQSANWYGDNYSKYVVSQLKSLFRDAATPANDFGYAFLPKLDKGQDTSILNTFDAMYQGKLKGYICLGQNPACSMPNADKARTALGKLDWMIHANIFDNETASFWQGPGMDPAKVKTEVFVLPAAASIEKAGSMTNSGRWVHWKYVAAQPPGDAISVGDMVYRLMAKLKELYQKEGGKASEPIKALHWDYADAQGNLDPLAVAKEINGYFLEDVTIGGKSFKKGQTVPSFGLLTSDGRTSAGNWLYSGMFTAEGENLSARRGKSDPTGLGLYPEWAWCWPLNRRILYNRASVDLKGQPYNPARPLIRWDGGKWVGDVPDGGWPPMADRKNGKRAFIMKPHGVASIFGPGLVEGPFPEHYEPLESPLAANPMSSQRINPAVRLYKNPVDKYAEAGDEYPYVCSTYTAAEHWCTGAITRWMSWLTEAMPQAYIEMSQELAEAKGIQNGDRVRVSSARGQMECVAMVTYRLRPFLVQGKEVHQVGMAYNYGWRFPADAGDTANLLTPTVGDANTLAPEYKAFMVNVDKA